MKISVISGEKILLVHFADSPKKIKKSVKSNSHMGCFFCQKDNYIDGIDCRKNMYVANIQ